MSLSNKLFNSKTSISTNQIFQSNVSFPSQKLFFEILFWENFNMFKNNITLVKLAIQLGYATSKWTHFIVCNEMLRFKPSKIHECG